MFDIAAFLETCIGPKEGMLVIGSLKQHEEEKNRYLVTLGSNPVHDSPDFDVTWCEYERVLNIGTYVQVERFGIEDAYGALEFAHDANMGVNRIGWFAFIHLGDEPIQDDMEITENDVFQHQTAFRVTDRFDDPSMWPVLGEQLRDSALRLFTEQAILEHEARQEAQATHDGASKERHPLAN